MKNIIFICVVGLFVASCHKEDVSPVRERNSAPTWNCKSTAPIIVTTPTKEGEVIISNSGSNQEGEPSVGGHGGTVVTTGVTITDPNDDEDGNGKKRKNK